MHTDAIYKYDNKTEDWVIGTLHYLEKNLSGIYIIINHKLNLAYVGASTDIRKRLHQHMTSNRSFGSDNIRQLIISSDTKIFIPEVVKKNSYYLETTIEAEYYSILKKESNFNIVNLRNLDTKKDKYDKQRTKIVKKIIKLKNSALFEDVSKTCIKSRRRYDKICRYNDLKVDNDRGYNLTRTEQCDIENIIVNIDVKRLKILNRMSRDFELTPSECLKIHVIGLKQFIDKNYINPENISGEININNAVQMSIGISYRDYYIFDTIFKRILSFENSYDKLFNYTIDYYNNNYSYDL